MSANQDSLNFFTLFNYIRDLKELILYHIRMRSYHYQSIIIEPGITNVSNVFETFLINTYKNFLCYYCYKIIITDNAVLLFDMITICVNFDLFMLELCKYRNNS